MHWHSKIHLWSTFIYWQVTYFMDNQEAINSFKVIIKSQIPSSCRSHLWIAMGFYLMNDIQVKCTRAHVIYYDNQSNLHISVNLFFSWENKVLRNKLSYCEREAKQRNHKTPFYQVKGLAGRSQSLTSLTIQLTRRW